MTLSIRVDKASEEALKVRPGACLIFFWHNELFVAPKMRFQLRKKRKMYGLVSASKDGAWLCELLKHFKVIGIRGSSSWRGNVALKEVKSKTQEECDIVITPDGPRGPRYTFKKGSLYFALEEKIPVIFAHFHMERFWCLRTWDGFRLPKPFSRITIRAIRHESLEHWAKEDLVERAEQTLNNLRFPF